MKEHEGKDGFGKEGDVCKHCGAMWPGSECECLERKGEIIPRQIPKSVVNDSEFISIRLAELRIEKDNMINHISKEEE